MKWRWVAKTGRQILPIVMIVGVCWSVLAIYNGFGGVDFVKSHYGQGATIVLLLLFFIPPLPSEPIAAGIATLHGFPVAVALYWAGLIGRSAIEYAGARTFFSGQHLNDHMARLPDRMKNVPIHHPVFLITGRWMPLGNHIVSVAAGAGRVSLGWFIVASAIGTLPLAIVVPSFAAGVVWIHG